MPLLEASRVVTDSVVILGTSGHAKVVIELFRAATDLEVIGCTGASGVRWDGVWRAGHRVG